MVGPRDWFHEWGMIYLNVPQCWIRPNCISFLNCLSFGNVINMSIVGVTYMTLVFQYFQALLVSIFVRSIPIIIDKIQLFYIGRCVSTDMCSIWLMANERCKYEENTFCTNEMEAKPSTYHKKGITSRKKCELLTRSLNWIQGRIQNLWVGVRLINYLMCDISYGVGSGPKKLLSVRW